MRKCSAFGGSLIITNNFNILVAAKLASTLINLTRTAITANFGAQRRSQVLCGVKTRCGCGVTSRRASNHVVQSLLWRGARCHFAGPIRQTSGFGRAPKQCLVSVFHKLLVGNGLPASSACQSAGELATLLCVQRLRTSWRSSTSTEKSVGKISYIRSSNGTNQTRTRPGQRASGNITAGHSRRTATRQRTTNSAGHDVARVTSGYARIIQTGCNQRRRSASNSANCCPLANVLILYGSARCERRSTFRRFDHCFC